MTDNKNHEYLTIIQILKVKCIQLHYIHSNYYTRLKKVTT